MYDPLVLKIAFLIHAWTSTRYFVIYAALVVLSMLLFQQLRMAAIFVLTLITTILTVWVLKHLFTVPRPEGALVELSSYAFPSGHAALSFAIATIGTLFLRESRSRSRSFVVITASFFLLTALLITYSRVVIGVHTWTQVIGGAFVGMVVPLLIIRFVRNIEKILI